MALLRLELHVPEEYHELITATLDTATFLGAESSGDELQLWFSANDRRENVLQQYVEQWRALRIPIARCTAEEVEPHDWFSYWRQSLQPIDIAENVHVVPSAEYRSRYREGIVIVIEPKMAFGTGHHPTTQLCAEMLCERLRPGQVVLDVGTGSGLLAIVAAKLGAAKVIALDNDEWAIENARENIALNCCEAAIELHHADAHSFAYPQVDGVVANLDHALLAELAPRLAAAVRCGGWLICSGVMQPQAEAVIEAIEPSGFDIRQQRYRQEWVALEFDRL